MKIFVYCPPMLLELSICDPRKVLFTGLVKRVQLPGSLGSFEVLSGHAPLMSKLVPGKVVYSEKDGKTNTLEVAQGLVEVSNDKVNVYLL